MLDHNPFPVSEHHLRLERAERRFHWEVNGIDYLSWRDLVRRVRPDRRYRVSHFEMPRALNGDALLALAHETLVDRSCTYIDTILQVGPEYQVPVGDLWETHTDPETGRTLVAAITALGGTVGDALRTLPETPPRDPKCIPMEMVFWERRK